MAVLDFDRVFSPGTIPSDVVFWTGAGISAGTPSNLPLGDSLTRDVVKKFCISRTWDSLLDYYDLTHMTDAYGEKKWSPRLESVMESLMSVYGLEVLEALKGCYNAEPNESHGFFAKHLREGGINLTANFDNCIEKALYPFPVGSMGGVIDRFSTTPTLSVGAGTVVHFHGRFDPDVDNLGQLGVRISNISSGLPKVLKTELVRLLSSKVFLVFAGYSGRDYFDVTPFFKEVAEFGVDLRNLTVVWLKYDDRDGFFDVSDFHGQEQGKAVLIQLQRCGADIRYVQVKTANFLQAMAERWWGLGSWEVPERSTWPRHSFISTPITYDAKAVATAQLYASMGIGHEIIKLKDEMERILKALPSEKRVRNTFLLNEGFRASGKYKNALKYARKLPVKSITERIFRHERIAGDNWLRGSHLKAAFHFYKALVIAPRNIRLLTVKEKRLVLPTYYETIITFLHWFRDVSKIRLAGLILPKIFAVRAFRKLFGAKKYLSISLGSRAKVQRLYEEIPGVKKLISLPEWLKVDKSELVSPFHETDSILGVINFTRRRITEDLDDGIKPERAELDLLLKRSKEIHDRPGILKATMLLKREYGFRDKEALKFLKEIEWTVLAKISWLSSWLMPYREKT